MLSDSETSRGVEDVDYPLAMALEATEQSCGSPFSGTCPWSFGWKLAVFLVAVVFFVFPGVSSDPFVFEGVAAAFKGD